MVGGDNSHSQATAVIVLTEEENKLKTFSLSNSQLVFQTESG